MLFNKLNIFIVALSVACFPVVAYAQSCQTHFTTITDLTPPTYGYPSVWDSKYGKREEFTQVQTGVIGAEDTVFIAGRRLDKDDFDIKTIFLAELNRRGRTMLEMNYKPAPGQTPIKMLETQKGFVLLSAIRSNGRDKRLQGRVTWFNEKGIFRYDRLISDAKYDYTPIGMVPAAESDGSVILVHAVNPKDPTDNHGVLLRYMASGELLWKRSYRPGIPNQIMALENVGNYGYLATGYIKNDDGRNSAWVLRLAYDGAINWQRVYPRGAASAFYDAQVIPPTVTGDPKFIVSGKSLPLDGTPDAAMVMQLDPLGEPEWTRYYRRPDYKINARWIRLEDDGRISVILDSEALDDVPGIQNHVRMLSLTKRGDFLTDEAYYVGHGARATDFISGWNGERIVIATIEDDAQATDGEEDTPLKVVGLVPDEPPTEAEIEAQKPKEPPIQRGWVMVGTALDEFKDPCD